MSKCENMDLPCVILVEKEIFFALLTFFYKYTCRDNKANHIN